RSTVGANWNWPEVLLSWPIVGTLCPIVGFVARRPLPSPNGASEVAQCWQGEQAFPPRIPARHALHPRGFPISWRPRSTVVACPSTFGPRASLGLLRSVSADFPHYPGA